MSSTGKALICLSIFAGGALLRGDTIGIIWMLFGAAWTGVCLYGEHDGD